MTASPSRPTGRRWSLLDVLRVVFVVAAVGFGIWGFRSYGPEIVEALASIPVWRMILSAVLVFVGLVLTGMLWARVLSSHGFALPKPEAAGVFFVGQIGKYIPGSVWSIAAQADMARERGIPPRTTLSVGLIFIWVNVASALPVGAVLADLPAGNPLDQWWIRAGVLAAGVVLLLPPVLRRIGRMLSGDPVPPSLGLRETFTFLGMMLGVWILYGAAAVAVVPPAEMESAGGASAVFAPVVGAFALSYVAGVVIVFAPAGVGVREAALIAMLGPSLGVPAAAAMALMIRLVHFCCDFFIAAAAWIRMKGHPPTRPQVEPA